MRRSRCALVGFKDGRDHVGRNGHLWEQRGVSHQGSGDLGTSAHSHNWVLLTT